MKKGLLATFATLLCVLTCALGLAACDDGSQTTTTTDPVAVENVTLSKTTLTLDVGDEETLTATVTPDKRRSRQRSRPTARRTKPLRGRRATQRSPR